MGYEDDQDLIFVRLYIGTVNEKYAMIANIEVLGKNITPPLAITMLSLEIQGLINNCLKDLTHVKYVKFMRGEVYGWNPKGPINFISIPKIRKGVKK